MTEETETTDSKPKERQRVWLVYDENNPGFQEMEYMRYETDALYEGVDPEPAPDGNGEIYKLLIINHHLFGLEEIPAYFHKSCIFEHRRDAARSAIVCNTIRMIGDMCDKLTELSKCADSLKKHSEALIKEMSPDQDAKTCEEDEFSIGETVWTADIVGWMRNKRILSGEIIEADKDNDIYKVSTKTDNYNQILNQDYSTPAKGADIFHTKNMAARELYMRILKEYARHTQYESVELIAESFLTLE